MSTIIRDDEWVQVKRDEHLSNNFNSMRGRTDIGGNLILYAEDVIKSILTDEVHRENGLNPSFGGSSSTTIVMYDLASDVDDHYNNSYLHNVTEDWSVLVTDHVASTNTLTLASAKSWGATDKMFMTNITHPIDTSSFSDTKTDMGVISLQTVIYDQDSSINILSNMLRNSFSILNRSFDKWKLAPMIKSTSFLETTLSNPMKDSSTGIPKIKTKLTPLSNVYSSFKLNYNFDYGLQDYKDTVWINGQDSNISFISAYIGLCSDAKTDYRLDKPFVYKSDYIRDYDSAEQLIKYLVQWFTTRRLVVEYYGNIEDHIHYEIGDQVKINVPDIIPTGVNNSAHFLVIGEDLITKFSNKEVKLTLIQLPEEVT